jgi:Tfp pilus assembly protein PilF
MTHPEMSEMGDAPANERSVSTSASDQERPVPSVDERVDRVSDPLQQARDFAAVGEMSAALTTLRALIAREPRQVRARYLLAQLLTQKGDTENALLELGRALDAAPDDVTVLCARAALYTARGKYDQAELDLRRAVKADDRNADVQVQLGVLFCKRARWREAIEPLRAAIVADPLCAAAHYHLGDAYNSIDDLPSALNAYEAAALLEPKNDRPLKRIGVVLDRMGRPAEAAAAYQRARAALRR